LSFGRVFINKKASFVNYICMYDGRDVFWSVRLKFTCQLG
jgi:hypothetical protein